MKRVFNVNYPNQIGKNDKPNVYFFTDNMNHLHIKILPASWPFSNSEFCFYLNLKPCMNDELFLISPFISYFLIFAFLKGAFILHFLRNSNITLRLAI